MDRISILLYKRLTRGLTDEETALLEEWVASNRYNAETAGRLADFEHLEHEYRMRELVDPAKARVDMERRIATLPHAHRHRGWRLAGIAAAIGAVVVAGAVYLGHVTDPGSMYADSVEPTVTVTDSVAGFEAIKPGQMKAILTDQSGVAHKLDIGDMDRPGTGLLGVAAPGVRKIEDLKLEVPRGGEFRIILEDSTEVWLNSESTLRYPEKFGPDERRVEVTGEAYFSVKPDKDRPFYVMSGGQQIRVYGTTFNVRGYADDASISTTLESGSIALTSRHVTGGEVMLSPGNQAVFDKEQQTVVLRSVNPQIFTGWRHGRFVFEDQTLAQIMRDLSRWYDFEYEFKDRRAAEVMFKGSIPRYSDLSTAILILEASGGITFALDEGNKIIISSKLS
ncbi:MAG: DUF4974 domain-containing protein [Paenibacillus sp.]|nr:DUF4974 domain-containing protein [Paenibacillus sp.]